MTDIIYRSSMGDKLAKLIVGCGVVYGAFYGGGRISEFNRDQIPYAIMKGKEGYYLIDTKNDSFRKIEDTLFEKVTDNNDSSSIKYEYGPLLPK